MENCHMAVYHISVVAWLAQSSQSVTGSQPEGLSYHEATFATIIFTLAFWNARMI